MELLPEWAPNVHPILVHFPIALLVIAVLFDGAALFLRKRPGVRTAAVALFTLGATAALAAFFTGRAAADEILLPAAAQTTLTDHADWALLTVLRAMETPYFNGGRKSPLRVTRCCPSSFVCCPCSSLA